MVNLIQFLLRNQWYGVLTINAMIVGLILTEGNCVFPAHHGRQMEPKNLVWK